MIDRSFVENINNCFLSVRMTVELLKERYAALKKVFYGTCVGSFV